MKERKNKLRVLVTAGPTREYLDPVRYLTNPSSGEMGLELARALRKSARVTLVSVPLQNIPRGTLHISVESAVQMSSAVRKNLPKSDVFIAAAAVSDWRFKSRSAHKLKRGAKKSLAIRLVANPDILGEAGAWKKRTRRQKPLLVGFALETKNIGRAMRQKLAQKNLDFIVGNLPDSFGSKNMKAFWLERGGAVKKLGAVSKRELSAKLARWIDKKAL